MTLTLRIPEEAGAFGAGRRAVCDVGEALGLAPSSSRWAVAGSVQGTRGGCVGRGGALPEAGAARCGSAGRNRRPAGGAARGGLRRPQRPAGAPGSPRAHRRQVGPGAVGCSGSRARRVVGTVPGYYQVNCFVPRLPAPLGTPAQEGRRGLDPAPLRWALIAGSARPTPTSPRRPTPGQLGVLGSGRHRPTGAGKAPTGEGRGTNDECASSSRLARVKDAKRPRAGPQSGTEDPFHAQSRPSSPATPHLFE